jgi:hypothetical protein
MESMIPGQAIAAVNGAGISPFAGCGSRIGLPVFITPAQITRLEQVGCAVVPSVKTHSRYPP